LRKRLAKKIAHDRFRDTNTLENMHAANLITDDKMKAIMTEATDKCYDLVLDLNPPFRCGFRNAASSAQRVHSEEVPATRARRAP
jgi:hypothetical protein